MKVLVGLGNPGRSYEKTRHNIGSRILKQFAAQEGMIFKKSLSLEALWGKGGHSQEEIRVVLPQNYMNLSGKAVLRCSKRWHFPLTHMLVVVDDLHLPLGELRIRPFGSDGGQKGLCSVIESLGTEKFPRLRVGIHPGEAMKESWEEFVLSPFSRKEEVAVEKVVDGATECCRVWIEQGIEVCMNRFNRKGPS